MKFDLQELCDAINERDAEMVERGIVEYQGVVYKMEQLPTAGDDPIDTTGIYSYDDTHMIVDGGWSVGLSVEPRNDIHAHCRTCQGHGLGQYEGVRCSDCCGTGLAGEKARRREHAIAQAEYDRDGRE